MPRIECTSVWLRNVDLQKKGERVTGLDAVKEKGHAKGISGYCGLTKKLNILDDDKSECYKTTKGLAWDSLSQTTRCHGPANHRTSLDDNDPRYITEKDGWNVFSFYNTRDAEEANYAIEYHMRRPPLIHTHYHTQKKYKECICSTDVTIRFET